MTSLMHLTTCTKEHISTVAWSPIMCWSRKIRDIPNWLRESLWNLLTNGDEIQGSVQTH
jgi:hypothetical protein